jgi:hypothetical protein
LLSHAYLKNTSEMVIIHIDVINFMTFCCLFPILLAWKTKNMHQMRGEQAGSQGQNGSPKKPPPEKAGALWSFHKI